MRMFIAVAAAIAATSVSFAVATAANQPAPVAQSSATDKAIVSQLKTLNRNVTALNRAVGTSEFNGMRGEVRDLIGPNDALGLRALVDDANGYLEAICRATRETSGIYTTCVH